MAKVYDNRKVYTYDVGWNLVTFGSGAQWEPALVRLGNQARDVPEISNYYAFREQDIPGFGSREKLHTEKHPRGFGLWFWKPRIIKEAFRLKENCDGVIYLDAGCEINNDSRALTRLADYLQIAAMRGGVAFELPFLERLWSHPQCVRKIVGEIPPWQKQIAGGILFLSNSQQIREVLDEWEYFVNLEDFGLLTLDNESLQAAGDFREHRHDQSILSLLWHKKKLPTIPDESFWHPNWKAQGKRYPIWATRSKLRISQKSNKFIMFLYRAMRFILMKMSSNHIII